MTIVTNIIKWRSALSATLNHCCYEPSTHLLLAGEMDGNPKKSNVNLSMLFNAEHLSSTERCPVRVPVLPKSIETRMSCEGNPLFVKNNSLKQGLFSGFFIIAHVLANFDNMGAAFLNFLLLRPFCYQNIMIQ